ncbi:hypothetical protein [Clostridium botulinum]|nr:hypothetical protein [Clostridium botulinum]
MEWINEPNKTYDSQEIIPETRACWVDLFPACLVYFCKEYKPIS